MSEGKHGWRFLDSSVLARAYLKDEPGHEEARQLLDEGERLLVSEIARVEAARAIASATRAGRLTRAKVERLQAELERDLGPKGAITVVPLEPDEVVRRATQIVRDYPAGTLDAIHLAVAEREGRALAGDELLFVTRDDRQRAVADRLGLATD